MHEKSALQFKFVALSLQVCLGKIEWKVNGADKCVCTEVIRWRDVACGSIGAQLIAKKVM